MKIYIGSDHGGYELKNQIIQYLLIHEYRFEDLFCINGERCDYPDCAQIVCNQVLSNENSLGIVICGTGIGISIACNRFEGIRCALCTDKYSAAMAKRHNNANIIAMGGRILNFENAIEIIECFLKNKYEGGRHEIRLKKIEYFKKKSILI